jgi:hypothetical protein
VEDGLDPNSMMGRAVAGPAESIYTANQISIVRPVDSDSDDEGGDEKIYRETFSPLNAEGKEAACLLGTSQVQKNLEKYLRTVMMQNRALAVSHFKRQIRTLIFKKPVIFFAPCRFKLPASMQRPWRTTGYAEAWGRGQFHPWELLLRRRCGLLLLGMNELSCSRRPSQP